MGNGYGATTHLIIFFDHQPILSFHRYRRGGYREQEKSQQPPLKIEAPTKAVYMHSIESLFLNVFSS